MSKKILEEFDKDKQAQVEKSEEPEAVVEPAVEETPAPEPEKELEVHEEELPGAVGDAGTPGTPAEPVLEPDKEEPEPVEEAKKDADEDSAASPDPKPFEKDGKVKDAEDHANGGNPDLLTKLTDVFTGGFGDVQKALGENQESVAQLRSTLADVTHQLTELRELVTSGFATKADDVEEVAEPVEAEKSKPKEEEAEKADKSKEKANDDCDDEDCNDGDKKSKDEDKKEDAKKSLEEDAPVAEPVPDEPLYVAKKSAAVGSVVEQPEVAEPEPEAKKSLGEQYVAAKAQLGAFNDKLTTEASFGAISRADYAEKYMLAEDIAYGHNITQEKLDAFVGYINK